MKRLFGVKSKNKRSEMKEVGRGGGDRNCISSLLSLTDRRRYCRHFEPIVRNVRKHGLCLFGGLSVFDEARTRCDCRSSADRIEHTSRVWPNRLEETMATLPIPFPNPGRPRRKIDTRRVIELRAKGVSWRRIAKRLGVGLGTVHRAAAAFQKRSKT